MAKFDAGFLGFFSQGLFAGGSFNLTSTHKQNLKLDTSPKKRFNLSYSSSNTQAHNRRRHDQVTVGLRSKLADALQKVNQNATLFSTINDSIDGNSIVSTFISNLDSAHDLLEDSEAPYHKGAKEILQSTINKAKALLEPNSPEEELSDLNLYDKLKEAETTLNSLLNIQGVGSEPTHTTSAVDGVTLEVGSTISPNTALANLIDPEGEEAFTYTLVDENGDDLSTYSNIRDILKSDPTKTFSTAYNGNSSGAGGTGLDLQSLGLLNVDGNLHAVYRIRNSNDEVQTVEIESGPFGDIDMELTVAANSDTYIALDHLGIEKLKKDGSIIDISIVNPFKAFSKTISPVEEGGFKIEDGQLKSTGLNLGTNLEGHEIHIKATGDQGTEILTKITLNIGEGGSVPGIALLKKEDAPGGHSVYFQNFALEANSLLDTLAEIDQDDDIAGAAQETFRRLNNLIGTIDQAPTNDPNYAELQNVRTQLLDIRDDLAPHVLVTSTPFTETTSQLEDLHSDMVALLTVLANQEKLNAKKSGEGVSKSKKTYKAAPPKESFFKKVSKDMGNLITKKGRLRMPTMAKFLSLPQQEAGDQLFLVIDESQLIESILTHVNKKRKGLPPQPKNVAELQLLKGPNEQESQADKLRERLQDLAPRDE